MRKRISEGVAGYMPDPVSVARVPDWSWRQILADGGILLALLITSSWLVRG